MKIFVSKNLWVNNIILMCGERHIDYGLPSADSQKKPEPHLKSQGKSFKRNLPFHTTLTVLVFRYVFMGWQLFSLNDC